MSKYQTFGWATPEDMHKIAQANPQGKQRLETFSASQKAVENGTLDRTVRSMTESQLTEAGMRPSTSPDLLVTYFAYRKNKTVTTNVSTTRPQEPFSGAYIPQHETVTPVTRSYREGTLLILMFDAKTLHPVWRGVATATVDEDQNASQDKIEKAVQDMFKDFRKSS